MGNRYILLALLVLVRASVVTPDDGFGSDFGLSEDPSVAPTTAAPTTVIPTLAPTTTPTGGGPTRAPTQTPTVITTPGGPTPAPTITPTTPATPGGPTPSPTPTPTAITTPGGPTPAPTKKKKKKNKKKNKKKKKRKKKNKNKKTPTASPSPTSTPTSGPIQYQEIRVCVKEQRYKKYAPDLNTLDGNGLNAKDAKVACVVTGGDTPEPQLPFEGTTGEDGCLEVAKKFGPVDDPEFAPTIACTLAKNDLWEVSPLPTASHTWTNQFQRKTLRIQPYQIADNGNGSGRNRNAVIPRVQVKVCVRNRITGKVVKGAGVVCTSRGVTSKAMKTDKKGCKEIFKNGFGPNKGEQSGPSVQCEVTATNEAGNTDTKQTPMLPWAPSLDAVNTQEVILF